MAEIKSFKNDSLANQIVPRTPAFKWQSTVTIKRAVRGSRLCHVTCALIELILN